MKNGLTVCLISDTSTDFAEEDCENEETESEDDDTDSDDNEEASDDSDDGDDDNEKTSEQKMVCCYQLSTNNEMESFRRLLVYP